MCAKYIPDKDNNHLRNLVLKWKQDPAGHHPELVKVLDKIITSSLGKSGLRGWNRNFEEQEDLLPTYRAFCVLLLHRIKPDATNQEMYVYLSSSIYWHNKNRKKANVRKNLCETQTYLHSKKAIIEQQTSNIWDEVVHFEDKDMNQLSSLLIQGHSIPQARDLLGWGMDKTDNTLNKIREYYMELGYGTR